jgi:hypothetical protein
MPGSYCLHKVTVNDPIDTLHASSQEVTIVVSYHYPNSDSFDSAKTIVSIFTIIELQI